MNRKLTFSHLGAINNQFMLASQMRLHYRSSAQLYIEYLTSKRFKRKIIRISKLLFGTIIEETIFSFKKSDDYVLGCLKHMVLTDQFIFYAFVQSVLEAWNDCGLKDAKVDELIGKKEMVVKLKAFRNAIFHSQKEYLSQKIINFLETPKYSEWLNELYMALENALFTHPVTKPIFDAVESQKIY